MDLTIIIISPKQFTCLGENTEQCIAFAVSIVKELIKMERKWQKVYLTYYNLLIGQNLWQSHYRLLSMIFLKEFIKLNVNMDTDKKCENCRITYKVSDCFLEYTSFKNDLIEGKCLCCNKNYKQKSDEKLKQQFLNTYKFFNHDNNKFILL